MAAITFPNAVPPLSASAQTVSLRTAWAGSWTALPHLHCTRLALSTGETLSNASFRYRFGTGWAPGTAGWAAYAVQAIPPLSYVRVELTGTAARTGVTWYGVWRAAAKRDVDQTFEAVGLEQLLDEPCRDVPFYDGTQLGWAGRGLAFNAGGVPNRSNARHTINGQSVYVFGPQRRSGVPWSTRDAVEMLLAVAAPKDAGGDVIFNWTPQGLTQLPDWDQLPETETDGPTYSALLRALVPRYRLIGFTVEPGASNTVDVRFFSFAETAISIQDLADPPETIGTIPASTTQHTLTVSADTSGSSSLVTEASNVVDQVIVTGARRRSVCTLSKADSTLLGKWTEELEAEYIAGASLDPNYPPATEIQERERRDRDARSVERLHGVFSSFGPPADWDQKAGDGDGGDKHALFVQDEDDAWAIEFADPPPDPPEEPDQFVAYRWLLRVEPTVPLRAGYDYAGDVIKDAMDEGTLGHRGEEINTDGSSDELPPMVFVRVFVVEWQLIDQVGRAGDLEPREGMVSRSWSAGVRPVDDLLGMEIRVQGEVQHVIAGHVMDDISPMHGSLNWEEDLLVTCSIADPRPVEVRYPTDADLELVGETVRRLYLETPEYQLIRVLPGTVVGVDPLPLSLSRSTGGLLQDDRPLMRQLAQLTYHWHKVARYALNHSTNWIDGTLKIGHLIVSLTDHSGTFPVLSVVTELTYDYPISSGDTPPAATCTIATSFAELEAQALV